MNIIGFLMRLASFAVAVALLTLEVGCNGEGPRDTPLPPKKTEPAPTVKPGPANTVHVAPNIDLQVQGDTRRVLVKAKVCCREGFLELFLTHAAEGNKSHESVLQANVDARRLHEALLLAKAEPGKPFDEDTQSPPEGQVLKVSLMYEQNGKQHIVPGQSWLRTKSGGPVNFEWVFAGSEFFQDERDSNAEKLFRAQVAGGLLMTVGNIPGALIDVNIRSARSRADIDFEYYTERIPPAGTPVTIILEPVGVYKKK